MEFPDVICRAACARAPHLLTEYLREFAAAANHYYEKTEHILRDDNEKRRRARLALLAAARTILANGLPLVGMTARESV